MSLEPPIPPPNPLPCFCQNPSPSPLSLTTVNLPYARIRFIQEGASNDSVIHHTEYRPYLQWRSFVGQTAVQMLGFRVRYVAQRVVSVRASIIYRGRCRGVGTVVRTLYCLYPVQFSLSHFQRIRFVHKGTCTVIGTLCWLVYPMHVHRVVKMAHVPSN